MEPPKVGAAAASAGTQIMISHVINSVRIALTTSSMKVISMLLSCSIRARSPDFAATPLIPPANSPSAVLAAVLADPPTRPVIPR
jgi:hypothetical protein